MSAPNPAPYSRPYRPRSIFGPLVLIGLGTVFLLRNIGVISYHAFGWWFGRYWPLLLILWGLIRLGEYYWARSKGYATPRMGAGGIFLLILLIMVGTSTNRLSGVNWGQIDSDLSNDPDVGDFFGGMFGNRYDFTDNFAQPVSGSEQIKIVGNRGDIKITPSQDGQAHAVIQKTLRTDSEDSANKLNESTKAKFEQQGSILLLDLSSGSFDRGRFNVDLELPPGAPVSVSTHTGDIAITERAGAVEASTDHGNISVENIKGDATVHVRRGDVTAKNVSGNLSVDGMVNDSHLSDIGGTVTMTGTYFGELQMARLAKPFRFNTSRTDLQFARLDGNFNMEPDELRANAVTGPFRLDSRSKGVHLQDVSGDIHIDNRNATVELRPKGPLGNIDVSNIHGEIDLTVPANAGFQLDATSLGGDIHTDFNVNVDNSRRDVTARGTVGKGGPEVRLKADRGTIQVRKQ